ncbi:MAG: hypothetical protein M1840_000266 [Geoglossum simile]|nr:MAG: hypothetical protein M1840_000266 [Geoglossum simile]
MALTGQTIAFSGTFPGYKQADLGATVLSNGGEISAKVGENCTHLVTSQADYNKPSAKNKQARDIPGLKVVSLDWLLDSVQNKKLEPEASYTLGNPNTPTGGQRNDVSSKSARADSGANMNTRGAKANDTDVPKTGSKTEIINKHSVKGKKRSRKDKVVIKDDSADDSTAEDNEPATKKLKDGQKAKSTSLFVPVDEGCQLSYSHRVYIGSDGTIYDAALNQTNVSNNNNKFYRIQLLAPTSGSGDYCTWTRWGRVGERGQTALLRNGSLESAIKVFDNKFKDKSGHLWVDRLDPPKPKKYTFIEKNYEESDDEGGAGGASNSKSLVKAEKEKMPEVKSALAQPVQRLMQLIFNQSYFENTMASMEYDADKLPLGKLSKRTIGNGFQLLKSLAEVLSDPNVAGSKYGMTPIDAIQDFTNQYYSVIPHSFGRNRPPVISTDAMMKKEIELLENLGDMEACLPNSNEIMKDAKIHTDENGNPIHQLDKQYRGLSLQEMTPLEANSSEYEELKDYLAKSHGYTHHARFKVQDIFRIERQGEFDRFDNSQFAKLKVSDRRLLWHGSRCTNFGGILSQGLRIAPPEAPVSGYMFGKGVYLADISSKSANYCYPALSGNNALLLLCEAELGKPMLELTNSDYNAGDIAKASGMIATWGKGLTGPPKWKDASCVNPDLQGIQMPDTSAPPGPTGHKNAYLQYNEVLNSLV